MHKSPLIPGVHFYFKKMAPENSSVRRLICPPDPDSMNA
jgi:hypothetical protein